jgi:pyrroline-5-carboxylate reductase
MATALAQGIVKAGLVADENLTASDPLSEALARFTEATGGRASADNRQLAAAADVIFLAVKPQQMPEVLADLRPAVSGEKLVVSIAAGIRLNVLAEGLGGEARLVRVMPNTPCLVGQGACGYCLGETATAEDGHLVKQLLDAVGVAYRVEEKLLDAVTGLSGSGPAFVYVIVEALSDGGVRMGLPRQVATALAAQTVRGAAEMVLATGEHTGVLKDRVTSPGGTTIAGLQAMESGGLRAALMAAVEAATRRSVELGVRS